MTETFDEREEELSSITAIFPELLIDPSDPFVASIELPVAPAKPLLVRFLCQTSVPESITISHDGNYARATTNGGAYIEHDHELLHLPPLHLKITLPVDYPAEKPPHVHLATSLAWLPKEKLQELEQEAAKLWEEYGQCQILFSYIDFLQQAAERGFDLDPPLTLPTALEKELIDFDTDTKRKVFEQGTYDCGICLEPKKGTKCYKLERCGHVFCKSCLQDFYNSAITEGDVGSVKCLDPGCGKNNAASNPLKRKRKKERSLHPRELLAMGLEESMVRRYVEFKRKKRLEADKSTVYCPRTWCQGPAKTAKYPPIPVDLSTYPASESEDEADPEKAPTGIDPGDRLAICEKCQLAFCKVCFMGWHGPFARCWPRNPSELTEEEKASYEYIRKNTSPCPTCSAPVQKTMGCNHMICFQCNSHFCYLCSSWLIADNPYQHFNKPGTQCYQRLWELEEGDEGQGPQDGRGFVGLRHWEQLAINAAREADAREAAEAAEAEEAVAVPVMPAVPEPPLPAIDAPIEVMLAQIQLGDEPAAPAAQRRRRQRNPFQPAAAQEQNRAAAVRAHERAAPQRRPQVRDDGVHGGGRGQLARGAAVPRDRQQEELRRFLELAQADEEDGWDSDGLDGAEEDEEWEIR